MEIIVKEQRVDALGRPFVYIEYDGKTKSGEPVTEIVYFDPELIPEIPPNELSQIKEKIYQLENLVADLIEVVLMGV